MKNLKTLLMLPAALALNCAMAQTESHLKLSNEFPGAGDKIAVSYDPAGTAVDGKTDITASVCYIDGAGFPAADIELKPDGKLLKGEIVVPKEAKAFFIKISADDQIDNNDGNGYVYITYKNKQPVEGAYASEAFIISSGFVSQFAKIKMDMKGAAGLYKKEFDLYPASAKKYEAQYYPMLAGNPDYKAAITQKIAELEKSDSEDDLTLAANLLKSTKNSEGSDSLKAIIKTKFPEGAMVKNETGMAFYKEKDLAKKDSLYQVYIKKYPENITDKNTVQDNFRVQLAGAYLEKGDLINFYKYDSQIKNKTFLAGSLNNVAYEWAKKGERLDDADKLSKESLDILNEKINNPDPANVYPPSVIKQSNQYSYDMDADTYAFVLYKESKFAEALKYEQPVVDHSKTIDPDIYGNYIQILVALGQNDKGKEAAETAVKAGQGSTDIKAVLKTIYVKANGKDDGYDKYIASLENASKIKAREDLAKTMIDQKAPLFALKDMNGKGYSLADLKGKVVIVDFWATWCGPCKASLPGMQMAVNKYKEDPNVIFLFVDTWEEGDNYLPGVKKFIADNNYQFNVLIDEKGDDGRQSKVVSSFGVTGIPTKFIIDKSGHIRFKYIGYSGTPEKLVDEVSAMVDMAGNPSAEVPAQKTSMNK